MSKLDFYDSEVFVDYYDILNISHSASKNEIRQSYVDLVKKYHPDQGGSDTLFRKINEAYEILFNDEHKKEYDAYYIRKNTDAFNIDDFIRLRAEHHEYAEENAKELTEEERKQLYNDIILSIQEENKQKVKDVILNETDILDKIDDLTYERKNAENEESNKKLYDLLDKMNECKKEDEQKYTVNDLFDFYKHKTNKNNNQQQNFTIMNNLYMGLNEINNPTSMEFSFVDDNINNANNTFHSFYTNEHETNKTNIFDFINNIDAEEFIEHKLNKKEERKGTDDDFEELLRKRREEENEIDQQVEKNLEKHKAIMNLIDDGDKYKDNLNFFDNYKNPFEDDLYGAVEKDAEQLNDIYDVKNVNGEFNVDDVEANVKEVKSFIQKTNKKNHEKKEIKVKENDIFDLINERKNIDDLIYETNNKTNKDNVFLNVVKRKSKFNTNDINLKNYEVPKGSSSKFKDLVKANTNNKINRELNLNMNENLGDIRDFYA